MISGRVKTRNNKRQLMIISVATDILSKVNVGLVYLGRREEPHINHQPKPKGVP